MGPRLQQGSDECALRRQLCKRRPQTGEGGGVGAAKVLAAADHASHVAAATVPPLDERRPGRVVIGPLRRQLRRPQRRDLVPSRRPL